MSLYYWNQYRVLFIVALPFSKYIRRMKGGREEVALSLGHGSVFWLIHAYEMRTKPE